MKVQRKVYEANSALKYFVLNNWIFRNENFEALSHQIKPEDDRSFSFHEAFNYDVILYLRYAVLGVKRYLLGDKDENIPMSQKLYQRLWFLDRFVKLLPFVLGFYLILKFEIISIAKVFY